MKPLEIINPEQRLPSKAYLVNELRKAVFTWRERGYPLTTDTTRRLLQFWFEEDSYKIQKRASKRQETKAFYILQSIICVRFFLNNTHQS